jgi:hypothetical protein
MPSSHSLSSPSPSSDDYVIANSPEPALLFSSSSSSSSSSPRRRVAAVGVEQQNNQQNNYDSSTEYDHATIRIDLHPTTTHSHSTEGISTERGRRRTSQSSFITTSTPNNRIRNQASSPQPQQQQQPPSSQTMQLQPMRNRTQSVPFFGLSPLQFQYFVGFFHVAWYTIAFIVNPVVLILLSSITPTYKPSDSTTQQSSPTTSSTGTCDPISIKNPNNLYFYLLFVTLISALDSPRVPLKIALAKGWLQQERYPSNTDDNSNDNNHGNSAHNNNHSRRLRWTIVKIHVKNRLRNFAKMAFTSLVRTPLSSHLKHLHKQLTNTYTISSHEIT